MGSVMSPYIFSNAWNESFITSGNVCGGLNQRRSTNSVVPSLTHSSETLSNSSGGRYGAVAVCRGTDICHITGVHTGLAPQ